MLKAVDIYDLSNLHFSNCKITKRDGTELNGCVVRFKVKTENGYQIYPAEKICFLPDSKRAEFQKLKLIMKDVLDYYPDYIDQVNLAEIKSILISPSLI